ncbi:MAG: nucleotide kinase [Enterobacter phage ENC16]|nr:MAG: nucleotide kinase [Enterobacter phage ENC16]
MADMVEQPKHYTSGDIECIDAIRASMTKEAFCGYLKGCAQKYLWRYEKKVNPVEDIKKARWYSERLIKELEDA